MILLEIRDISTSFDEIYYHYILYYSSQTGTHSNPYFLLQCLPIEKDLFSIPLYVRSCHGIYRSYVVFSQ